MVKIIADTTSCLSTEFAREHGIPIIPQVINFGNESFLEGVNLDIAAFMQRLTSSTELPKTAAPPPELFSREFERLVPLGEPILCIMPSTEVSGTVRSATIAAQDFSDADIRIIDTRVIASPLGTLVELAAGWAEAGMPIDQIVTKIESYAQHSRVYFLVDTLEYLARGGRIGGASALLGSVLQIKPILRLHDGQVDQYERERTHKRALARLKEIVLEQCPHNANGYLTILYSGDKAKSMALAEELGEILQLSNIPVIHMPPAIVSHGGPGILGVGFITAIN